jgi:hypothetical protein
MPMAKMVGYMGAGLAGGQAAVPMGIINEERGNGNPGTNVTKVGTKGEPHVVMLPERALSGLAISLILNNRLRDLG